MADKDNILSSYPNYNGFYIINKNDSKKELSRTGFFDTNNFENARKWVLAIWDIQKMFKYKKKRRKSKKRDNNNGNNRKSSDLQDIEYYAENELFIKNGFSDFISCKINGYYKHNHKTNNKIKNEKDLINNTLKYMVIIPNKCQMRFKGVLLFDCVDFAPNFGVTPFRIRMKQQSLFINKENNDDSYFEFIGDLTKCHCNTRNDKSKYLWNMAFKYYTIDMIKQQQK